VGGGSFCNRRKELADLTRAMENGERLFLHSERRMGKTSLVRAVLSRLPKDDYLAAYVDLWPTDGIESFAAAMAKAITEGLATSADRMLRVARDFFGSLSPAITADPHGNPQLTFEIARRRAPGPALAEVLAAPQQIARRRGRRVIIVFDEFQRILEYETDMAERTLRSAIQNQPEVAYVFLGSRRHIIQRMFLDQARPLYRSGTHYPLGPIDTRHWLAFIRTRFLRSRKQISDVEIHAICERTGGHPFYTQHLCHAVWEICEPGARVTPRTVADAVDLLLDREGYAYTALWESFGLNPRRLLAGLAASPPGARVFGSDFIQRQGLHSPSTAQRVVKSLMERDVIDRDNGSFLITDRFFKLWIQRLMGMR
jgi:hypothetical protein